MIAVWKKFRPLVEWSSPWLKEDIITFKYTEPAPPCSWIEWWSMLNELPFDVMWDVIIPKGLYMCAECCWSWIICHWSHMTVMPLFEVPCAPSICLCCLIVRSFDTKPKFCILELYIRRHKFSLFALYLSSFSALCSISFFNLFLFSLLSLHS